MGSQKAEEVHNVRVSYGAEGRHLKLAPVDDGPRPAAHEAPQDEERLSGVLRIGDGCITLELPTVDGRVSRLAWDPAEVDLADLGMAAG